MRIEQPEWGGVIMKIDSNDLDNAYLSLWKFCQRYSGLVLFRDGGCPCDPDWYIATVEDDPDTYLIGGNHMVEYLRAHRLGDGNEITVHRDSASIEGESVYELSEFGALTIMSVMMRLPWEGHDHGHA